VVHDHLAPVISAGRPTGSRFIALASADFGIRALNFLGLRREKIGYARKKVLGFLKISPRPSAG